MGKIKRKRESWQKRRDRANIKHNWQTPFVFGKWICEQASYFLGRSALFEVLEYAGRLAILVAIIFYFRGCRDRENAKHFQAWQVINSARGNKGSGGRIAALDDLYRDGVSLAGLDISKAKLSKLNLKNADLSDANLSGAELPKAVFSNANLTDANLVDAILADANLPGAILERANLTKTWLFGANLSKAFLTDANLAEVELTNSDLSGATLERANLTKAYLAGAILSEVWLTSANLTGADLTDANLPEARFADANLVGAVLRRANLAEAYLAGANLTGANLSEAVLTDIVDWRKIKSIKYANIYNIRNAPKGFIEWATKPEKGAVRMKDEEEWEKFVREKMAEAKRNKEQQSIQKIEDKQG